MCTFSASTAACERGFSAMNRQKTKSHTLLKMDILNAVMRICINGPKLADFDAAKSVKSWQQSGKRHLESGHKPEKRQKTNADA